MFTSTRNKPFPSYDFIIINASTLRKKSFTFDQKIPMKIVFYYPKCPSKFVTMHRFCTEILSRRKNPSVNAQAKEKKQRRKTEG